MNEITANGIEQFQAMQAIEQELFKKWLNYLDCKPKTAETYTKAIKRFVNYLAVNCINKPLREDIINYKQLLTDEGLKPTTVKAYIIAVKQFFKWTESEGLYKNIADRIKTENIDTAFKKDYLTAKQASILLGSIEQGTVKGVRDKAIIYLMLTTGLRTIEIARANIEDLRPLADNTVLYVQGKGHVDRNQFVKIEPEVETAIRAYLKSRPKRKRQEPLFASVSNHNYSGRLAVGSISRIAKQNLRAAGYDSERLTAHSFRHTAATLNLLNGGTPRETMQLLRHSSINTTMIYSHDLERITNNSESRIIAAIKAAEKRDN